MRLAATAACSLLLAACAAARPGAGDGPLPVLHPLDAALLWHELAATPTPPGLAAAFGDVCGEHDEAARAAAVAGAGERLAQARREAAAVARWEVPLRQALGGYDLQRGGFPLTLRTGGVVRFDQVDFCHQPFTYLVAFANGDDFAFVKVADEAARRFVRANRDRTVDVKASVEARSAGTAAAGPALVVRLLRVEVRDAQGGELLGVIEPR